MHSRRLRLAAFLAFVALLLVRSEAAAKSFVWRVTNDRGGVVYLAGSVHILSESYYPLDAAFNEAFEESDLLVEEIDMGEMLSSASQMKMLQRGMLPAGQSLDRLLPAETLRLVQKTVEDLGLPFEPLKLFKPWMLALTLQSLAWDKAGFDAELGLDRHFYDLAKVKRKPVQGLETLEYQLSRFDGMSKDVQDRMLVETIKELETTKESFTEMADAWKNGDVTAAERLVLQDLKSEPQMYDRLLLERNHTWLPKIEALFARPAPAFVVVGAAHLIGSDGLLRALEAKGYHVTQL